MTELPPLPEPAQTSSVTDSAMRHHEVSSYTADQMRAYAAEAVRVALEQAAQVCDSVDNHSNPMTATDCAELIRALKGTP